MEVRRLMVTEMLTVMWSLLGLSAIEYLVEDPVSDAHLPLGSFVVLVGRHMPTLMIRCCLLMISVDSY